MKRTLTALFLTLALAVGLAVPAFAGGGPAVMECPYFSVYDLANQASHYPMAVDAAGPGWSWNAATRTMTLNNYQSGTVEFNGYYTDDMTITVNLSGENTITGALWGYCFGANGGFTVTGSGSLTITTVDLGGAVSNPGVFTMQSGTVILHDKQQYSSGIGGKIVMNGGTLEIDSTNNTGHDLTLNGGLVRYVGTDSPSYAPNYSWPTGVPLVFNGGSLSLGAGTAYIKEVPANGYTITDGEGKVLTPDPRYIYNADDTKTIENYKVVGTAPILITGSGSATQPPVEEPKPQPEVNTAFASTQKVDVDGKAVEFQMYALKDAAGNDTNYVKLRDVASVLNGTRAQFQVGWDGAVNIVTGQSYTANGSEMSTPYSGDRAYEANAAETRVNGAAAALDAIVLKDDSGNGYTYYKLRDLGNALGFVVDWTAERGVYIETK